MEQTQHTYKLLIKPPNINLTWSTQAHDEGNKSSGRAKIHKEPAIVFTINIKRQTDTVVQWCKRSDHNLDRIHPWQLWNDRPTKQLCNDLVSRLSVDPVTRK